jgi:hypothetical protein
MTNEEDLEIILLATSTSRQMIFNFMRGISLLGAAQCLESKEPEAMLIADTIMSDVIEGYQHEEHIVH